MAYGACPHMCNTLRLESLVNTHHMLRVQRMLPNVASSHEECNITNVYFVGNKLSQIMIDPGRCEYCGLRPF
eukprot:10895376-Heterocapsa_arctica.AAC.1